MITSFTKFFRISPIVTLCLLALQLYSFQLAIYAQNAKNESVILLTTEAGKSTENLSNLFPNQLGTKWKTVGEIKKIAADKLPPEKESQLYLEYGLQSLISRTYTNGKVQVIVKSYAMKYPSGAYGLWTFNRKTLQAGHQAFNSGRYYFQLSSNNNATNELNEVKSLLQQNLSTGKIADAVPLKADENPSLPTYLPEENKIVESEKYMIGPVAVGLSKEFSDLKDLIDFTGGTHAASANYQENNGNQMSLILIEYQTPQFASDGYARLNSYISSLSEESKRQRILKRVGNYVIEGVNVTEISTANSIVEKIKYMVKVYWEGQNLGAVPLEQRPPDPTALNEAVQTGRLLFTVFYWIGLLFIGTITIGLVSGGTFFYWRRSQRRKMGLENVFSDAGGIVRLNLDRLLASANENLKLLGKKE